MSEVRIYMIKGDKGFLASGYTKATVVFGSPEGAQTFSSEEDAKKTIREICKHGNIAELSKCKVLICEFTPVESFSAIEIIIEIGRWAKVYKIIKEKCTVTDLLLHSSSSKEVFSKTSLYQDKLKKIDRFDLDDRNFMTFKEVCKFVMNEKFKEKKNV